MSPKRCHDNVDVDDEYGDGEGETKTIQIVKNSRKGEKVICAVSTSTYSVIRRTRLRNSDSADTYTYNRYW